MKSETLGANTSPAEVTNISAHGLWLYVNGREHFLSYEANPWFKTATVAQILNVQLLHGHHLHWPDLDVDLEIEALEHPERFPLVYR